MFDNINLAEIEERYKKLYLSAVTDVLDEKGYMNQWLGEKIKPLKYAMKIAGPAFTVKWISDPTRDSSQETLDQKMVESIPKGYVAVIDPGGDTISGHWGELTNISAKEKGCRGVVANGGVRDTNYLLKLDLPIFSKFTSPLGAYGRSKIINYQIPIMINGVKINPGDYIVGDIDGIAVIPTKLTLEVLEEVESLFSEEAKMREELRKGVSPQEVKKKYGRF